MANAVTISTDNTTGGVMFTDPTSPSTSDGTTAESAGPRLSVVRVMFAVVLVLGGVTYIGLWLKNKVVAASETPVVATWSAPYVDTTLTPMYQFQDPTYNPMRQIVLGFIVADPQRTCAPSWGAAYTIAQADQSLSLSNRIAQFRAIGGSVITSFGGQANSELALTCTNVQALAAAYLTVINHYQSSVVDFDIEGAALQDAPSITRRALAIAAVQSTLHAHHRRLAVWLTLPVTPSGLQSNALMVVTQLLRHRVALAGINLMTMDFGTPMTDMLNPVESALQDAAQRLAMVFPRYGLNLAGRELWNHLGVTVMIGRNDSVGESFTIADAQALDQFAQKNHLGRLSYWSLNRDTPCGTSYAEIGVLSNSCSGVDQTTLQFSRTFANLSGAAATEAAPATAPVAVTSDNPATSPYPIWQPVVPYPKGYKVVRLGNIYLAQWYNQGQDPAQLYQGAGQTPWLLIGPVLAGSTAPTTTTLPAGTYPQWSPKAVYEATMRVLFNGLPYEAKWYNNGSSPAQELTDPSGSPWLPLFNVPGEPPTAVNP